MKRLLIIVFALIVAAGVGFSLREYPGTLIISVAGWRVDISLWLGLVLLLAFYAVVHVILSVLVGVVRGLSAFKRLFSWYSKKRSQKCIQKGLIALVNEDYQSAEHAFSQGAPKSELPWLNYLFAAKVAHLQNAQRKCENYMKRAKALASSSEARFAINLTQAKWQFERGETEESLNTLTKLNTQFPNHPAILKQLQNVYFATKAWRSLLQLLPKLKAKHLILKEPYEALEYQLWYESLKEVASSIDKADALWKNIPKHLHQKKDFALLYAKILQAQNRFVEAEMVLRCALKYQWDEALIFQYGEGNYPSPQKYLSYTEAWLKTHADSPGLLFVLGKISEQQSLWEQAQSYYESSLKIKEMPQTYAALGHLYERINQPELAAQNFNQGLCLYSANP